MPEDIYERFGTPRVPDKLYNPKLPDEIVEPIYKPIFIPTELVKRILIRAFVRFIRTERGGEQESCEYESAMHVVSINGKYTTLEIKNLAERLAIEQETRWFTGAVERLTNEIVVSEIEITEERYNQLKDYFDGFNEIARDLTNWKWDESVPYVAGFVVSEHILTHAIYCGFTNRANGTDEVFMNLVDVENPCVKEPMTIKCKNYKLGTDSQSLYVFDKTDYLTRCKLNKRGGWGSEKRIKSFEKKTQKISGRKTPKEYPNPLPYNFTKVIDENMRNTLEFMKEHGLNPIPLEFKSKIPSIKWDYLKTEPIKKEHAKLFLKPSNIGVMAGYNNVVVVDSDVGSLDLDTTTIKTKRGFNYIFFTDEPFGKKYDVDGEEIVIKRLGYIVLPPSIHPDTGLSYEWIKKVKPSFIKAKELSDLINKKSKEIKKHR